MDIHFISRLVDQYSLKECIAALIYGAPDLLEDIRDDIDQRPDDPQTIKKARDAVHRALERERKLN